MKIAIANVFLPSSQQQGVAIQVHGLANVLARRGHEVTVFSCSMACEDAHYETFTFGVWPHIPRRLYSFAQALSLATTDLRSFDVVHAHGDNYLLLRQPAQVRTFHGSAKAEARVAQRFSQKAYYCVMTQLEAVGARISAHNVGISETTRSEIGRIDEVIPCGIDLSRFRAGRKSEKPSILFVGGLYGRKRGLFLAKTFLREVRARYPDAELWIVSGEYATGDGVVNHGRLSDDRLAELYRSAWVFCMPSTYEGFGVPYIEAMASGTPAVASPNAGAKEVLAEGAFGELAPDEGLGSVLLRLLGDAERRSHFASRGMARARDYDWDVVASRYETAYANVAARKLSLIRRIFRPVAVKLKSDEHVCS